MSKALWNVRGVSRKHRRCAKAAGNGAAMTEARTLREACEFAIGAIEDAIGLEDGLDGKAGESVLKMLREALASQPQDAREALRKEVIEECAQWCYFQGDPNNPPVGDEHWFPKDYYEMLMARAAQQDTREYAGIPTAPGIDYGQEAREAQLERYKNALEILANDPMNGNRHIARAALKGER